MPSDYLSNFESYIQDLRKNYSKKQIYLISLIFSLAVFLRLWNLSNWFSPYVDYDEGAWVVAARLLTQGENLYTNIFFVHPPLFEYTLASIYQLFGYNFIYARYTNVIISIATLLIWFAMSRKLVGSEAAIFALALFALDPINVFHARRAVQEPLGLLFLTTSLYFLSPYIKNNALKMRNNIIAGVCLGFMIATKYIFLPAVFGIGIGLIVLIYIRCKFDGSDVVNQIKYLVILSLSAFAGFFVITWNIWLNIPDLFLQQTFFIHIGREGTGSFPSIISAIENFSRPNSLNFTWIKWYHLPMFVTVLTSFFAISKIILELYNKTKISNEKLFLTISLFGAVILCQFVSHLPRYYVAAVPFFALVVPCFLLNSKNLDDALLGSWTVYLSTIFIIFVFVILVIPVPFTAHGYDITWQVTTEGETEAYNQTSNYLEKNNASIIYSTNPTVTALTKNVSTTGNYESFANLYLRDQSPEHYAEKVLSQDVDYIIFDPWFRRWAGGYQETNERFANQVKSESRLVHTVQLKRGGTIEIYRVHK